MRQGGLGVIVLGVGLVVAAATTAASAIVYGSRFAPATSPLQGSVVLSAVIGGVALAFSRPLLLVAVPYLLILLGGRQRDLRVAAFYLGAFGLVFVVAISGSPASIALPLHRAERLIDAIGGLIFLASIAWALFGGGSRAPSPGGGHAWRWAWGVAGALGATAGAVLYHELDPVYDSVFFSTGNAVAASHAPLTASAFVIGLAVAYLTGGTALRLALSRTPWGHTALLTGRAISGIATALVGLAVLTGRFDVVRTLLIRG